ncbi:hypothetical protein RGL50_003969 [Vibrio alginolyticus]|jgi:hypothetical protein|uniref:hypothetical protein n=1 Tax=Vibrio jasicida TaxID=766224 RepID=UPI002809CD72|nr:hypothetical protein [Vibrio alginolyticus]
MIDKILARYWQPKGTPLYKHHLPMILIAFAPSLALFFVGIINHVTTFAVMVFIVGIQFLGMWLSRKRFGNRKPNETL